MTCCNIKITRNVIENTSADARFEKRRLMSAPEIYSPGLEGVIAGETAISTILGGLRYRGYPVTELAEKSSFDEVAYLLLHGDLPTSSQLADFQKRLADARRLPDPLRDLLNALP